MAAVGKDFGESDSGLKVQLDGIQTEANLMDLYVANCTGALPLGQRCEIQT
jgi:hypothetical protein